MKCADQLKSDGILFTITTLIHTTSITITGHFSKLYLLKTHRLNNREPP